MKPDRVAASSNGDVDGSEISDFGRGLPAFRTANLTPDLTPTLDVTEADKEIEITADHIAAQFYDPDLRTLEKNSLLRERK